MQIKGDRNTDPLRIGVIGRGAIGGPVADHLAADQIRGAKLVSVLRRNPQEAHEVADLRSMIESKCDLVVEAAGHRALQSYGVSLLNAGVDLLVLSVGALAEPELESKLRKPHSGRLMLSTGAIGGFDILKAHTLAGTLRNLKITSTSVPSVMAPLFDGPQRRRIEEATHIMTVASGSAREIALRFPRNANVAATLALATLGLDEIEVEFKVDPLGVAKRHVIEAAVVGGSVTIDTTSHLSSANQNTSAVTPYAVIRMLTDLTSPFVVGV